MLTAKIHIGVFILIEPKLFMKKRLLFLLFFSSFLIVTLLVRIAYIQVIEGPNIRKKAFFQQNAIQVINPSRGNIYDRNGNTLATSEPVQTVTVNPKEIDKSQAKLDMIGQGLEKILGISREEVIKKLNNDSYFEIIKRKVDLETADKIKSFIKENNIKGIYLVDDTKRYYPNKNLAAHVVGFTDADGQGLQGIEQSMEEYLKGVPGEVIREVDAGGRTSPISPEKYIQSKDGLNVVLTIDNTIQDIASKAMEEAISKYDVVGGGVAIVMDPRNGDVLAMVSKPDFNLNDPYKAPSSLGVNSSTWNGYTQKDVDILNSTVWRNKAVSNTYEPGSTFKAITSAAALEEGTVKPDSLIDDSPVHIDSWTINSFTGYFYKGMIPFREGVYESSNPVFVRVGQGLGIERFYQYVRAFGLYDRTDIELPGEQKSIFQKSPAKIDLAAASFGQRFTVTPIQMAAAYTAIANGGGLMKPRLVKKLTDSEGNVVKEFEPEVIRKVISKQTSEILKDILEGVVSEGSGKGAYVNGYRVAGKTGTSQTTDSDVYVASFAGLAPADNPIVNVLVTFFNPRGESYFGGAVAAPVAGKIIEDTLNYLGIERR